MSKTRAFVPPVEPVNHVVIDRRAMNEIKDIAHKIWMAERYPNANLIMLEATRQYIERKGAVANFTVQLEVK